MTVQRCTVIPVVMSEDPAVYDLAELSGRARVTPRTIRYYIQQGLLRSPGVPGPGARYGEGHLDRLRLIRRLQQAHLPLAEIRRRLEGLSDDEVREVLARGAEPPKPASGAADYARAVLDTMGFPVPLAAAAVTPPAAAAPRTAERSQWERISLTPDLELHLRRPLSREHNKLVERLLAYARRLLEEEAP